MGVSVSFFDKGEYLLVKSTGSVAGVEDIVNHAKIIFNETKKYKYKKLLVDVTDISRPKKLFYYYEVVQRFKTELTEDIRSYTVALFITAEYNDLGKFFETVAVNRGLQFYTFTSMQEAIEWLTSK
ncbi:MAG: hypothetical protein HZB42_14595 [Sphingobacteriales bacterium]|nr:hypothetical protein [Sphingobacteriales bacterium]